MNVEEMSFEERLRRVEAERARQEARHLRMVELRSKLINATRLEELPDPVPLLGNILYRDSLAWIYGAPASYKSFVALDIAGCVATGESWQGQGATTPGPVLYLAAEGASGLKKRVRAWQASMGVEMVRVEFLPEAVQALDLLAWQALVDLVTEMQPVLIVIDTQARVTSGIEENSATEVGRYIIRLDELRVVSAACVLTIHHTGRGGDHLRGSIAMEGAANTTIKVTRTDDIIKIECTKQKDAPEFEPFSLRLIDFDGSAILGATDGSRSSNVDGPAVRQLLTGWWHSFGTEWVSYKMLEEATEVSRRTILRKMKSLVDAHIAEAKGEGHGKRVRLIRKPMGDMGDTTVP